MASAITIDTLGLDHTTLFVSNMLSSQKPIRYTEPRDDQIPMDVQKALRERHASIASYDYLDPNNITETTDKYLFQLSIESFTAKRNLRHPPNLD
ncbi:hypothetical protein N8I77_006530 [Diaporthe amygdali]|uniref:Uncharacterized protein n=1 Tax=Phomopsis amygdali TaxID=1214568 RepID=A0AAD9SGU5_PHOAM|nr:hypothetical protein N8I77_006530 [Diaporthe amygdali]